MPEENLRIAQTSGERFGQNDARVAGEVIRATEIFSRYDLGPERGEVVVRGTDGFHW